MGIGFKLFSGKVMHKRLFPKENGFYYNAFFVTIPLGTIESLPIARNKFGTTSFYDKDHGARDGTSLKTWANAILTGHGVKDVIDITLMTTPRYFGYGFNPISYWFCCDAENKMRAILCEVHNTFGEQHTYICLPEKDGAITEQTRIKTEKVFHVSPFMERQGRYEFRFKITGTAFASWIDYYDSNGTKMLITSLMGTFKPWTKMTYRKMLIAYPLNSLKTIGLIHWQALKLVVKGIKYIPKQKQKNVRITKANPDK